tara:strand:+ start:1378 stop:2553 length:1176 start_codon:yes stop_codon:yes gene_type:complete
MNKDIVIIGGGSAGLSLACSLSDTNLKIAIIEQKSISHLAHPIYDGKEIALTHFSKKILEQINIWNYFPKNKISHIKEAKVMDGNSPYTLNFDRRKIRKDALGYLISNNLIRKALYEEANTKKNVEIIYDSSISKITTNNHYASIILTNKKKISASLIVAADSRFSQIRRNMGISANMQDFGRVAIVCKMKHKKSHNNIAYECFHYGETLAVLPLIHNTSSIVITVPTKKSIDIMNMNKNKFNYYVSNKFGNKLGNMELINKRFLYPLIGVFADNFIGCRLALIGDAAVGMHPVTAHGFNLGLKGQNTLSLEIKSGLMNGLDIGSPTILKKYEKKHKRASKPLYLGTNTLVKLYTNDSLFSKIIRKTMLRIGNNFIPAKRKIINQLTEITQ